MKVAYYPICITKCAVMDNFALTCENNIVVECYSDVYLSDGLVIILSLSEFCM